MPGVTPKGFRRFTNDEKREFVRLLHEVESVRGGRAALLRRWGVDKSTVQRWLDAEREGRLGPQAERTRWSVDSRDRARLVALERENEQLRKRVETAEAVMAIMGKAHELLQTTLDEQNAQPDAPKALMSLEEYQAWLKQYRVC